MGDYVDVNGVGRNFTPNQLTNASDRERADEMIQRLEWALKQISAVKTTKACINDKITAFHNVQCVLSELKAGHHE